MCRFSSLLTVSWLQVADPRAKAAGQDLKGHSCQPAKQLLADATLFFYFSFADEFNTMSPCSGLLQT
jgi:hypothetical protein